MIECPWCSNQVELADNVCPECRHEILPEHLDNSFQDQSIENRDIEVVHEEMDVEAVITEHFKCAKCGHGECLVKEVAMTGTGLSKIFDVQYNHYLFVSCVNCSFVEIYDPSILRGKRAGTIGTIADVLFGS